VCEQKLEAVSCCLDLIQVGIIEVVRILSLLLLDVVPLCEKIRDQSHADIEIEELDLSGE
jgi:hypothetical protein